MSASRSFPVRYWTLVFYTTGVPGLLRFDVSGRTHEFGLFNIQSFSVIALEMTSLFLFVIVTIMSRQPVIIRRVRFEAILWIAMLFLFGVASVLEPKFHLSAGQSTDLILSFYRLGEWALAFLMFLALYSRVTVENSSAFVSTLIARICWIWIALVWVALLFAPSFVYSSGGESDQQARLGGALIHPSALGVMCCVCCFHAITLLRGNKRMLAIAISLVTLAFTYARAEEGVMLLSLAVYGIVFSKGIVRLLSLIGSGVFALVGFIFASTILSYAARGNGLQNIVTLSDRTLVWDAAIEAIKVRPWIGYGFITGVKGALKDHWKYAHWLPPHAHNELLQSVLSGGFVAGALLLAVYYKILRAAFRVVRADRRAAFFLFTLFQFLGHAFLAPLISGQFGVITGLLIFCSVHSLDASHSSSVPRLPAGQKPEALRMVSLVLADCALPDD